MAIAVIVDECATCVPALAVPSHTGLFRHIREGAVAVVVVQHVLPEIRHKEIFVAVVIVIPDADALAPARMQQAGLRGYVRKRSVAIVLEEMRRRSLSGRRTL